MSNNLGKVVRFTNITDKDFTHAFGGQPFFIKARETVMLPWDLADHLATHLSRRIFIDGDTSANSFDPKDQTGGNGRPLWDEKAEADMKLKILGESFNEEVARPKTETEILAAKVAELEEKFGRQQAAPVPAVASNEGETVAGYKDKKEVIDELVKLGVTVDARQTKAKLEAQLADLKKN